jgi:nucleotide-binding universal stress UspA family protein
MTGTANFSKILVAVDGSKYAKKAFDKSMYLAQKCDSKIDLIHVVDDSTHGGDNATAFELIEEIKEKGSKLLERCKNQAIKNNIVTKTLLEIGDPAQVIVDISNKNTYDLIIMGSRGMSTFKELLLGSVSLKVMDHARCPVMIVK